PGPPPRPSRDSRAPPTGAPVPDESSAKSPARCKPRRGRSNGAAATRVSSDTPSTGHGPSATSESTRLRQQLGDPSRVSPVLHGQLIAGVMPRRQEQRRSPAGGEKHPPAPPPRPRQVPFPPSGPGS